MRLQVQIEGRDVSVDVERADGGWRLRFDEGEWQDVPGRFVQDGEVRIGQTTVGVHSAGDRVELQVDGYNLSGEVFDPRKRSADLAGGTAEGTLVVPMPGVVVRVPVEVGAEVHAGQVVVVVEAMKMENEFKSPCDGTLDAVEVSVGQVLDKGQVLARITPS